MLAVGSLGCRERVMINGEPGSMVCKQALPMATINIDFQGSEVMTCPVAGVSRAGGASVFRLGIVLLLGRHAAPWEPWTLE
jgi:hypothetical protein